MRKFLGRFRIGTGQGDMIGFVLLKKKNMVKAANHYNRDRAVWFCSWDHTVRYGRAWKEADQAIMSPADAADLARLLRAAVKEARQWGGA